MTGLVPVAQATPPLWDEQLASSSFYSSSSWLRFCDVGAPGSVGTITAELPGGGRAGMPAVLVRTSPMRFYRWHDILSGLGLPSPAPHGLLAGPSRGYQATLLVTSGSGGPGGTEAAAALLPKLHAAAEVERVPCVAMYLGTEDVLAFRAAGVKSPPVYLDADPWISIPADGWDAWLSGLSRHRRTQIRRDERAFAAAGFEVSQHRLAEVSHLLGPLWAPTQAKYYGRPFDPAELTAQLRVQAEVMGDAAKVLLCGRPDEPPVGFLIYYRWRNQVYLRTTGFDYERLAGAAEYFNLSYYHHIRHAPALGVSQIHAGIKSVEAKVHRGARLRPLWLLDLSPDSVLAGHDDTVAAHNMARYQQLLDSGKAISAAIERNLWEPLLPVPT